ncbi:MAG: hypothetical protein IPK78_18170 [Rhodospirillales bacterium]|nr:hypothetical protein [Rhodospirillales bacterium]
MPRGIPNNKKPITAPSVAAPEPLIILQPDGDNWQFNAYGLDLGDILRALRLTLIHLAAQQAGVVTIEATISARNIVLASPVAPPRRAPVKPPKARQPARNGYRTTRVDDEDEDLDAEDLADLMSAR